MTTAEPPHFPPPPGARPRGGPTSGAVPGHGPPWEVDPGIASWFATAGAVLLTPRQAFGQMRRSGGIGLPILYGLLGLGIGMAGSALWRAATMSVRGGLELFGLAAILGMTATAFVVAVVFTIVGVLVFVAAVHVMLLMLDAARHGFEATLRALVYAYGSAAPFGLVPVAGSTIGVVWAIVVAIPGLAELQQTRTSTAAIAVLTPAVLCCGLAVAVMVAAVTLALGSFR